jgi:small-conductance mechanosensitive channel
VRRRLQTIGLAVLFSIGLTLLPSLSWAQTSSPSPSPSPSRFGLPQLSVSPFNSTAFNNTEVTTAAVRLDGRKLFTIAAPAVRTQPNQTTTIDLRAQGIESTLNRLANRSSESAPQVSADIDPSSNLPILSVNQQYLMTVTTLDAQVQGQQQPAAYANDLTRIIRDALIQARQERQPDYLTRQSYVAIAIIFAMMLLSWGLSYRQKQLRDRQKRLRAEIPQISTVTPTTADTASRQTQLTVKRQLDTRQQHTMKDVQRRLLQLVQLGIWAIGSFTILGLFPYTRFLQPIVLSTPLKVLSIVIGIYLLIRLSDLIIDRVFSAFSITDWATPDTSQRVALRVSTFSRITKNLALLGWIGIGITVLLTIVGIQVLPLLAGAGIIGLGISLASQNLIKDVINGFFILFEDQYAVGDVIQVGSAAGLVEHMSLRITQLRNAEGRLITIPNSAISVVENLSKDWSRVDLAIAISYDADINLAIDVIRQVGQAMIHDPAWQSKFLEPPEVLGVDELNSQGVTLRVWIKTQPLQQWLVGREFRRRLKQALDEQGIEIGIPKQALSVRGASDEKVFEHHDEQADIGQTSTRQANGRPASTRPADGGRTEPRSR